MYARQPPDERFSRGVRIPSNYSGNAFRQQEEFAVAAEGGAAPMPERIATAPEPEPIPKEREEQTAATSADAASVGRLFSAPGFRLDLRRLFCQGRGGGGGLEELLIIGLIFLVSQGEKKDDLVFWLLLLLLLQ